jgi:hypothetical protein
MKLILVATILLLTLASCGSLEGVFDDVYIPSYDTPPMIRTAKAKIMIFGGRNNEVFLGCVTCSEFDSSSLANKYGDFGSSYSSTSIFNSYSQYGSYYGTYSACNPNAANPPVIVDNSGTFYAHLSMNPAKRDIRANRSSSVTTLYRWLEEEVCD